MYLCGGNGAIRHATKELQQNFQIFPQCVWKLVIKYSSIDTHQSVNVTIGGFFAKRHLFQDNEAQMLSLKICSFLTSAKRSIQTENVRIAPCCISFWQNKHCNGISPKYGKSLITNKKYITENKPCSLSRLTGEYFDVKFGIEKTFWTVNC